jgi:DNA invertase Pin-like site-specific DNA recombinase
MTMSAEILHVTPTTAHRAKMAYVYIRQSSLMQVTRHGESTDLQYSLVERAVALGWPRERVELIDEDLGKSGAQAEARSGFQRLLAEISLARVGLVLSFDASRLARNNRDWYQLLEVCSIFGTLIADGERLYDPRLYHDRLLLGLSGMMSSAQGRTGRTPSRVASRVSSPSHRRSDLESRRRSPGTNRAGVSKIP